MHQQKKKLENKTNRRRRTSLETRTLTRNLTSVLLSSETSASRAALEMKGSVGQATLERRHRDAIISTEKLKEQFVSHTVCEVGVGALLCSSRSRPVLHLFFLSYLLVSSTNWTKLPPIHENDENS